MSSNVKLYISGIFEIKPLHLNTASPSSLTASPPQTGHTVGISKGFSSPVLFSFITSITSGITSPAF